VLCGSSDAPVEIPNPLLGIYQAVYRQKSYLDKVLGKEEKISMFDAISLYTTRANIPTYHVNRGMIDIGFIADFTMLNQDPFQVSQEQWTQLHVTQTIINEQQVYKK
jgi:predicted amidohydrolase YtcJ